MTLREWVDKKFVHPIIFDKWPVWIRKICFYTYPASALLIWALYLTLATIYHTIVVPLNWVIESPIKGLIEGWRSCRDWAFEKEKQDHE